VRPARRPDARFALGDAGTSVVWAGLSTIVHSEHLAFSAGTLATHTLRASGGMQARRGSACQYGSR
jgi:hypothetical protein